jgi:hypothetical protein
LSHAYHADVLALFSHPRTQPRDGDHQQIRNDERASFDEERSWFERVNIFDFFWEELIG